MNDQKQIYHQDADQYHLLVSREDYQQNIFRALNQLKRLSGLEVIEPGAGTGRLTCILAPVVKTIQAFDLSPHMLRKAASVLREEGVNNGHLAVADHRNLPVGAGQADLVIAGWSICYLAVWNEERWRDEVHKALAEMKRVLRPCGTIVILETLGTGFETPQPPDHLSAYFACLQEAGFHSTWIRTDYRFSSLEEAEQLIRFFFGAELAEMVAQKQYVILPECTGIWWLEA
jgi:ubiquinone/menaquinone biosynthesis C-methylase UbiE